MTQQDDAFLRDLTAREALLWAAQNLDFVQTDPGDRDFEPRTMAASFAVLNEFTLLNDALPEAIDDCIRTHFIHGAKNEHIPDIACQLLRLILSKMPDDEASTQKLVLASIQITAAALSLMKKHEVYEKRRAALCILDKTWTDVEHFAALLLFLEPTDSQLLRRQRALNISIPDGENNSVTAPPEALKAWLGNTPAASKNTPVDFLVQALRRRENGDPSWFAAWLRNLGAASDDADCLYAQSFGRAFALFETFWQIQAWRNAGALEKASILLEKSLAMGLDAPQLWLLQADLAIELNQFGKAEHAIDSVQITHPAADAGLFAPTPCSMKPDFWHSVVEQFSEKLALNALHNAMNAREVSPELLSLSMKFGTPETFSQAVLCAFDADCLDQTSAFDLLPSNHAGRKRLIEKLLLRHDPNLTNKCFRFCQELQKQIPNEPDLILLETVSQIDDPYCAAQTLRRALNKIPCDDLLYWPAAQLWIDLQCTQGEYEEAVTGIIHALGLAHPRATRTLILLMAQIPHQALPMLQTLMLENLGPETTRRAFERARKGEFNSIETSSKEISFDELALTLLPIPWQMIYYSARLNPPQSPEETAKNARREAVLSARGHIGTKHQNAPEPASWVHNKWDHASNAFDPK